MITTRAELLRNREALDIKIARLTEVLLATEEGTPECDRARLELNNHRGMAMDVEMDLLYCK